MPSYIAPDSDPFGEWTVRTTCFLLRNYVPQKIAPLRPMRNWHPPPEQVVLAGVPGPSCIHRCHTCSLHGCDVCPSCPLKFNYGPSSLTVGVCCQSQEAAVAQRAYLILANKAFPVANLCDGLLFCFDSSSVLHGFWAPRDHDDDPNSPEFYGIQFATMHYKPEPRWD